MASGVLTAATSAVRIVSMDRVIVQLVSVTKDATDLLIRPIVIQVKYKQKNVTHLPILFRVFN